MVVGKKIISSCLGLRLFPSGSYRTHSCRSTYYRAQIDRIDVFIATGLLRLMLVHSIVEGMLRYFEDAD